MGSKENTRKQQRGNDNPKWKKSYSEMTTLEIQKRLGFRLENIKDVDIDEALGTHEKPSRRFQVAVSWIEERVKSR